MLTEQEAQQVIGREVYGRDGEKIGQAGQVFFDDRTRQPEFVTVSTGLLGMKESFVPLADAHLSGSNLTVPFSKDEVKDAPSVSPDAGHLSQDEEAALYDYYGIPYSEGASESGMPDPTVGRGTAEPVGGGGPGYDTSGPTTDEAMTRSEERVDIGTRSEERGRARLRKYVETEYVQTSVPVSRERAVIETEPITEENKDQALGGPEISEEEHEVVLHEEKPVVSKHTEPVERVRLAKERDVREETVSEEVRKERIESEGDVDNK